jgi:tRNA (guanine-N7-)-methyltransferase
MRKKRKRFADNAARHNVLQSGKELFTRIKGNWAETYFGNDFPIVLEIGCGKGEYTIGLAQQFREKNFIGVDIKGARIWVGSSRAIQEELNNVAFLRIQVQSLVDHFATDEVDEIWLTFPDPRPKESDEGRRLTNPRFIDLYQQIMKPGGLFHLKSDNSQVFDYTVEVLESRDDVSQLVITRDLYHSDLMSHHYGIITKYERLFHTQGFDINYLRCRMG